MYCSAGAELGRPGYYLIAYDDTNDHRMLACFTPAGRGVCYSTNGNIRYGSSSFFNQLNKKLISLIFPIASKRFLNNHYLNLEIYLAFNLYYLVQRILNC